MHTTFNSLLCFQHPSANIQALSLRVFMYPKDINENPRQTRAAYMDENVDTDYMDTNDLTQAHAHADYSHMAHRLTINSITPNTQDWLCKIQVVDKFPPRDTKDKMKKYQLLLLQDEKVRWKEIRNQIRKMVVFNLLKYTSIVSIPCFIEIPVDDEYGKKNVEDRPYGSDTMLKYEHQILATIWNADITQFANHFKPFQTYLLSVVRVKESTYEYAASFNNSPGQSIKMLFLNQLKKSAPPESPLPPPARLVVTPFDAFDQQAKDAEFGVKDVHDLHVWAINTGKIVLSCHVVTEPGVNQYETIQNPSVSPSNLTVLDIKFRASCFSFRLKCSKPIFDLNFILSILHPQIQYIDGQLTLANQDQLFRTMACLGCNITFPRITDNTGSATACISDKIAEKMLSLNRRDLQNLSGEDISQIALKSDKPII
uniref:Uncharacterized protein n=1 Tax=Solanum lycopersicum TaxID=4081 RepID=A0A3Q7EEN9_SOLLC